MKDNISKEVALYKKRLIKEFKDELKDIKIALEEVKRDEDWASCIDLEARMDLMDYIIDMIADDSLARPGLVAIPSK